MPSGQKRFGTFAGVFLPNVLTIFGVILFYREGWVVGNAGLMGAIIIIILANIITISTALSLSGIVTNIKVKGGGAYFLVSRSLGPEMGGAIGITLFFAQAFSISFYIIGFTKALAPFIPELSRSFLNIGTLLTLTVLSIFSAKAAIKAQYIIFLLVLFALASFFIGNTGFNVTPKMFGEFKNGDFWKTFAIFFPAVTGIFAGLSLSGDLKNPNKSIPKGTIIAICFTFVFYILVAVWFAYNFSSEKLIGNDSIIISSARIPMLVIIGIWAATLSSAIGVLLGAPRTLQALGKDKIVPGIFAKGSGSSNEPRIAMIFSVILAGILLMMGDINFISQLLTMFFLASYGILNFIASMEVLIGNPAYRPKFRVHWLISLTGSMGSFAVMFLINQIATLTALFIIVIIYIYYTKKGFERNWGDIRKGFWASVIEIALSNYNKYEEHPRNWRPQVAIFENNRKSRSLLAEFTSLIVSKNGIVSDYVFIEESLTDSTEKAEEELSLLKAFLLENEMPFIHPEIILTNKDRNAHLIALQSDGVGSFKANTIVSDFFLDDKSLDNHFRNLSSYEALKKNIILIKDQEEEREYDNRIDIWISGFKANISMMLLIPFLITKNQEYSDTNINLRMIVRDNKLKKRAEKNISSMLNNARINAHIDVIALESEGESGETEQAVTVDEVLKKTNILTKIVNFISSLEPTNYRDEEKNKIREIIKEKSKDAKLVVLGISSPAKGKEAASANAMKKMLDGLGKTILVKGRYNISLFK